MLLAVACLGIQQLNAPFINIDELSAYGNMGGFDPPYSPLQIVDTIYENSPDHVPLWFITTAGLTNIIGWSQVALRLVSVLTSLLACASLYRFTLGRSDKRTAEITLFLFVANAYLLQYTYRILMYPMLMLLAIFHCWLYFRLVDDNPPWWAFLLFALTAAAIVYTHLFGLLILLGLGFYHVFFVKRSRIWAKIIAVWLVAGALFLPYAPRLFSGYEYNLQVETSATIVDDIFSFSKELVNDQLILWIPVLGSWAYILIRRQFGLGMASILIICLSGFAAYLLLKLILGEALITRMRYLFSLWFLFVALLAYSVTFFPRWLLIFFLAAWCIAFLADMSRTLWPPPSHFTLYRIDALDALRELEAPQEIFVGAFGEASGNVRKGIHEYSMVDYYLRQIGWDSIRLRLRNSPEHISSAYRKLYNQYGRFLLGYQATKPPDWFAALKKHIEADYIACAMILDDPTMRIARYVDRLIGCEHQPASIVYNNGIQILSRASFLPEEEKLRILTWIETASPEQQDKYNISWQLISPDWRNLRQIDKHLNDPSIMPISRFDLSVADLPPGAYRLMLILYSRSSGAKIHFPDPSTGLPSGFLSVLDFVAAEE